MCRKGDKMTAEKYLEQIGKIDSVIINKLNDYRRWVEIAEGIGGFSVGERVQTSRNLHRGADAIGCYLDIESEIKALREKRQSIIDTIELLPRDEYKVIYKIFVEGCMLKEIPSFLNMSYGTAKKIKCDALGRIQDFLDKKEE